jgi:hypothetical protein
MSANCLLPGSTTLVWCMGVFVLDVVTWTRVIDKLTSNIMHVQTFVEECT